MHLLLVDDDPALTAALVQGFGEHGLRVSLAVDFASGRERLGAGAYDVVILDEMLPGGSGTELCRLARREGAVTPVLMLTAKDTVDDRVRGLEAGADDYLTKPFAFRELLARVRALGRRPPAMADEIVTVDDLQVDLMRRRVIRGRRVIELTAKEFALLTFFVQQRDRVVDRAAITAYVWDENHDPFTNVLEVLVARLRRKIDGESELKLIHTRRGEGYRFGL